MQMPQYLGAVAILLVLAIVLVRVRVLRSGGVAAMKFGSLDKTDFVIPPFALLYVYLIIANAFRWPDITQEEFFHSPWITWIGVSLCAAAPLLIALSLISFGMSFRVGIDADRPGLLVTSGIFGFTRNPMYVAFAMLLLGEFLIQSNWILLIYLIAGIALFHRQVLREEDYLAAHYGEAYQAYCRSVRRYL
jgi:protein-S-isoprenylcysteine O-methyltransferase Ste14